MAYSGQKTVTTAGTAVALGTTAIAGPIMVKAIDTNTGVIAIGNDGANDVTVNNGLRLLGGESVVFSYLDSLASLYIDSTEDGEGVSWIMLGIT